MKFPFPQLISSLFPDLAVLLEFAGIPFFIAAARSPFDFLPADDTLPGT